MAVAGTKHQRVESCYSTVLGVEFTGTYLGRQPMPNTGVKMGIERDIIEVSQNDPLTGLMEEVYTNINALNIGTIWKGFLPASESNMGYGTRIYTKGEVGGDGMGRYKIVRIKASQREKFDYGVEIELKKVG